MLFELELGNSGYDAWIVTQREYGEDTVFRSLVRSTTMFSAHRRMLWMFHTNPDVPCPVFYWNNQPEIWTMLNESLHEVNPKKIAVNVGRVLLPLLHDSPAPTQPGANR
jgi:hypothetical protein